MDGSAATILYIEDSLDNRILVRRVLLAEGYDVLEAGGAAEGLELAQNNLPDLVLVDINMPHLDGLSLASMMKADPALESTPVVALTANVMRGDRERTLAAGCDGYIQKPIDVDTFPQQIAYYLQQRPVGGLS
jgi:two-component system, cell cycle response regulator DivK